MPRKAKATKPGLPLVIVESPAKARTLHGILGAGYVVKASLGHVRDLPPRSLGIDVENGFAPTWQAIPGRKKVLAELKAAVAAASDVFLAPDPDREGEAIAWHLAEALGLPPARARRIAFHEITEGAVRDALRAPAAISMDRVNAQQARRLLDRLVGYKLSPLLWAKVAKGLSAGRVQTVAVRLVVEREREIARFASEEHWTLRARLEKDGRMFAADLTAVDGLPLGLASASTSRAPLFSLATEAAASALVEELKRERFEVRGASQQERAEPPRPPLTTSGLQQEAALQLRWPAARTMKVAQQLYEGVKLGRAAAVGLITYMRTDSFRVSGGALAEVRDYIATAYGAARLPEKPVFRGRRKGAQDAHEAIRPTRAARTPEEVRPWLTHEQAELYRVIWRRFVASQMKPARWRLTEAELAAGRARFTARGRELLFDGWTALTGQDLREGDQVLPPLAGGDRPSLKDLAATRRRTEPPARYTEASLIRTLEKHGIGRPSTYAPILAKIRESYVREDGRALLPTELGTLVVDRLLEHFDALLGTGFTAKMEKQLDRVEAGTLEWTAVLRDFHGLFTMDLEKARAGMSTEKGKEPGGVDCAACGQPMLVRWTKGGRFLGCSGYPDCKATRPLPGEEPKGESCGLCGAPMAERTGRFGRFLSCSAYPRCKGTRALPKKTGRFEVPADWKEACDKCGAPLKIQRGKRGGFILCSAYPRCKNSRRFPRDWDRSLRAAR